MGLLFSNKDFSERTFYIVQGDFFLSAYNELYRDYMLWEPAAACNFAPPFA